MGGGSNIEKYKTASPSLKKKTPLYHKDSEKKIKVLLAHDNRLDYHTSKAHRFAEWMDATDEFEAIIDKDVWEIGERTSITETNRRETEMVKRADVILRLVPPSSKIGESRHEGARREVRKAIRAQKPIIEIFYQGAHDRPNRPIREKNYKNRVGVHIQKGESVEKALRRGLNELSNRENP